MSYGLHKLIALCLLIKVILGVLYSRGQKRRLYYVG